MVEPVRHRRTKVAATDMFAPKATASHLDFTSRGYGGPGFPMSTLPSIDGVIGRMTMVGKRWRRGM